MTQLPTGWLIASLWLENSFLYTSEAVGSSCTDLGFEDLTWNIRAIKGLFVSVSSIVFFFLNISKRLIVLLVYALLVSEHCVLCTYLARVSRFLLLCTNLPWVSRFLVQCTNLPWVSRFLVLCTNLL